MDAPRGDERTVSPAVTRGTTIPDPPVRAAIAATDRPWFSWANGGSRMVALGAAATVEATGSGRFEQVRNEGDRLLAACRVDDALPRAARPRLFGGFAFHEGNGREGLWAGFPNAGFLLPAVQLTETDGDWWLTVTATGEDAAAAADERLAAWEARLADATDPPASDPPGIRDRTLDPSPSGWRDQVEAAIARIEAGDLEKVVLAQALEATLSGDLSVPSALDRLADAYPDCYRFAHAPPEGGTFFGATPERLVAKDGRTVETTALAGSTGRGDTRAEDEWLADDLADNPKAVHEHRLVVQAIREQLEPMASYVSTGEVGIRRLATIQHLRTEIEAELTEDRHVLSLVEALHPTPAVGGLPPDAALRTIRDSETFDRGWYAGPVGWFDASGNGRFAVAIRSALAHEGTATLFAGNGIVADSDPDREYEEVQMKYPPMLDVLE